MPEEMDALKARARAFAEGLAAASEFDLQVSVASEEPDGVTLAFDGPDAHLLVGRHGQGLDALQFLAMLVVNRHARERLRVVFDADRYRARREEVLVKLARDLAAQVKESGEEAVLDPLSPMERRIVHSALVDDPAVTTYSEGEEPNRYIIISPAG